MNLPGDQAVTVVVMMAALLVPGQSAKVYDHDVGSFCVGAVNGDSIHNHNFDIDELVLECKVVVNLN